MTTYSIVGGGIVGASVAYHLSERTTDPITVYERQSTASETTAKSVAQFGFYGDETQYRMKRYGMKLYNHFFSNPRANPRYAFAGLLQCATTTEGARELERAVESGGNASLGKVVGTGFDHDLVEYIPGNELEEALLVLPLDTDIVEGALYRPKMGYMSRPRELAREFFERARENGVRIQPDSRVDEITTENDRVSGLVVDGEEQYTDKVVCAAGPWNVELARSVGIEIPVRHTLAPVLQLEPPSPMEYSLPVLGQYDGPHAIHRRDRTELLIGYNPLSTFAEASEYDPDTTNDEVPQDIRAGMLDVLTRFPPGLSDSAVVDEWVGIRSQTPDGNPIVGWTDLEGFSIAAFHTSGIQLAPAVGRIIAKQLVDDDPTSYYSSLSVARFDGYSDHRGTS